MGGFVDVSANVAKCTVGPHLPSGPESFLVNDTTGLLSFVSSDASFVSANASLTKSAEYVSIATESVSEAFVSNLNLRPLELPRSAVAPLSVHDQAFLQ